MNKSAFRLHHIAIPALAVAAISALGFALVPATPAAQAAAAAQAGSASGPTAIPLDYVYEPVATPAAKPAVRRAPNSIAGAITLTVRSDDAADSPIPNWSVVVSELSSGVSMTGTTSASGDVVLWLAAGNYKACEILPAGYVNVYPGDGCYWITLTDIGEASLLFRNAPVMLRTETAPATTSAQPTGGAAVSVALLDDDNIPQPGWAVSAQDTTSGVTRNALTNQRGVAAFALPGGNYKICETVQNLYLVGYPGSPCYWVSLVETDTLSLNFGNVHLPAFSPTPAP